MPYVKIRDGTTYGKDSQYKPGDVIKVTDDELRSFADKFTEVYEPAYPNLDQMAKGVPRMPKVTAKSSGRAVPDITRLRMEDVLKLVRANVITPQEAISVEQNALKPRSTLLANIMYLMADE